MSGKRRSFGAVLLVILMAGGGLAACGGGESAPGTPAESATVEPRAEEEAGSLIDSLADTEWRLLYFESMDDAQGRTTPERTQTYTMRLNSDGTVNMKLNCNVARGNYVVDPASDGSSGRFTFGQLAVTKALCAPPSMDERIAADAQYVRGFLLRDGNLYLSLMADAGIYAWAPSAESAQ